MFQSILVPVDGSPFAEQALPLALSLARRSRATVDLLLVHVPQVIGEELTANRENLDHDLHQSEQKYLGELRARLIKGGLRVQIHHPRGEVIDKIEEAATERDVDMVVLATHGRGPLSRFWLGSVADGVMRQLSVPLLMVRPHERVHDLEWDHSFRHILIPLDGSPLAEIALTPALSVGRAMHSTYTLLRVVSAPLMSLSTQSGHRPTASANSPEVAQAEAQARDYLEGVAARLRSEGLQVQTAISIRDKPVAGILDTAESLGCDLIALATHGRGGLQRLLMGSVADKVVRGAAIPVLVYRAQEQ